ncbi:MAG: endonuclease domain-containing protein [Rivularia sp. (in: Bacteria)]|nr:endonuclease domain-containing protein [Rivularia sp. MS3]
MEINKHSQPSPPSPLSQVGRGGTEYGENRVEKQTPSKQTPLSQSFGRGAGGEGKKVKDKWHIPPALRKRMIEIARQFRKNPTPSEAILWQALRNRQLEGRKFRRQQPIGNFIVDFFCGSERLIVEVDGKIHESQKDLDQQRQQLLESLGLRFVRISSELVETNLPAALEVIRQAFSPHPPTPSPNLGEGEQEIKNNEHPRTETLGEGEKQAK